MLCNVIYRVLKPNTGKKIKIEIKRGRDIETTQRKHSQEDTMIKKTETAQRTERGVRDVKMRYVKTELNWLNFLS